MVLIIGIPILIVKRFFGHPMYNSRYPVNIKNAGIRIKTKRLELRIKQYELAKRVGMNQSSLSELESGESKLPSADILIKLAAELGVTPAWIVTGLDGDMEVLTPDQQEFISAAKRLTADQRAAVFALINSMLT